MKELNSGDQLRGSRSLSIKRPIVMNYDMFVVGKKKKMTYLGAPCFCMNALVSVMSRHMKLGGTPSAISIANTPKALIVA